MLAGTTTPVRQIIRVKSAGQLRPRARTLVSSVLLSRSAQDWQQEPVSKLKDELKKRGLPSSGNKSALITRIVKADHARELASLSSTTDAAALIVPPVPPLPKTAPSTPTKPRSVSTTARVQALVANSTERDKFSPRPFAYAFQMPDAEPDPEEPAPNIPFLADAFFSRATESASPPQLPPTSDEPKVITVASASTHLSGGPVSNVYETVDAHAHELEAEAKEAAQGLVGKGEAGDAAGVWATVKEAVGWEKVFGSELEGKLAAAVQKGQEATEAAVGQLPEVGMPEVEPQEQARQERMRDMTQEERSGMWAIGGILAGGWVLGSIFAPNKRKAKAHKTDEVKH